MRTLILAGLILFSSAPANAGRIFTFLEGQIVERSKSQVVIATVDGVYWVDSTRPLSWLRKLEGTTKISFWIRMDQIKRFRPNQKVD